MTRILNQAQAEALYSAMSALNKTGGKVDVVFGSPDDGIHVHEYKWGTSANVYVYLMSMGLVIGNECYADQNAFAAAYGLGDEGGPQNAVQAAAGGMTQVAVER